MKSDSETSKALNTAQTSLRAVAQSQRGAPDAMFIPDRLYIAEHPEIDVLPLNILFAKSGMQHGKFVTGTALYNPDLSTLELDERRVALTYRNLIDCSWSVLIEHDNETKSWRATKTACGKPVIFSNAKSWEQFFKLVTMVGLQNGEPCAFLNMPEKCSCD